MSNEIKLHKGDCIELLKLIPDNSVDLVLTDPPYGTTQCKWDVIIPFEKMWEEINRVTKNNGAVLIFGAEPFSSLLRCSNLKMYKYDWVWDKVKGTGFLNAKKQPMRNHEVISVFYKKQCYYNPQKTKGHTRKVSSAKSKENSIQTDVYNAHGLTSYDSTERYPRSIQVFSTDVQKSALHPNQKPVNLLEYLINTYSKENETVLDFTMGSGSTGVACVKTGRKFIGIEKDEIYYSIAQERIENEFKRLRYPSDE